MGEKTTLTLFAALQADKALRQAQAAFSSANTQSLIYGVTGAQKSVLIASAFQAAARPIVIIAANHEAIDGYRSDFAALLPAVPVVELPAIDIVTFAAAAKSVELAAKRMDVLSRIARGEKIIVLATVEAAMQKVLPKQEFLNSRITIHTNSVISREELVGSLVGFGYERVDQVDSAGQFCVRGGIIDIFAVNRSLPLRLELFDDEVDSLREFDPVSQRSVQDLVLADIMPLTEPEHSGKPAVFVSYLPEGAATVLDEPARLREQMAKLVKENPEIKRRVFSWAELVAVCQAYHVIYLSLLLQKIPGAQPTEIISITAKGIAPFHRQIEPLIAEIKNWQDKKYNIALYMPSRDKALNIEHNLANEGITTVMAASGTMPLVPGAVVVVTGSLSGGFEFPQAKLVVLTELDIFGRQKKKRRPRVSKEQQITYFRDINIGDYVVHVNHGIGKYVGVETLEIGGVHKDYLHIRYAGDDKLYVPTDQVGLLQKYIGSEGEVPRLSKMGGSEWLKVKTRAKAAVADMARELITLYAQRQLQVGHAFGPDTPWQREFEDAFSYEETPDQLQAIAEVKHDMEQPRPMDRLLCGDVGFGKTEVAIRAAFKAVMGGKQVAVLVPTTVLAQQHYQTFSSRFKEFGTVVDVISRFRSAREQKATLHKLALGQIDVLIGTHRILQSDIAFKDIGLLIVDEEQRFGVAQKEKMKKWRANLDVLTLSATPIPRTLHMSLVGARDMSIIETPPEDRFPVQSYVVEYNEEIIREAIVRELKRGGQVYFVYNRVQTIDKIRQRLSEILPDAMIKTGHGQMPEELLEQVMLDFYEGRDDVLLCTSIIENGLDVPNANTIIVYDADHFGLSQLYQMRGRVGRSHRMAYAYFTYRQDKVLTEVAEKRLQAIKEFAELGSGFKIAMRDLEIRGAGNLLGREQHGHIVSVGFEMYCRLLDEAVEELKTGKITLPPPEPTIELTVDAYLTGDYISDAMHKIEIYQRIAAIRNEEHLRELLDELIDRFGEPPLPVTNLLGVARIKNVARHLGIRTITERSGKVEIIFGDTPNLAEDGLVKARSLFPGKLSFMPGPPQAMRLNTSRITMPLVDVLTKLLTCLAGFTNIK
ncbi:transcription-repair coupling factor [Sporomusa acidovorans]|uniref:Transcription-repair-coupling factor n=1 Tax=Sporomusa acidovorans (strain ATCC 49682 / DSM 3132 / Mol) TaxID=1123286 RepID=A0ABZ3IW99_SPOA4|nr:transcription-repair coupling factor [Sporomusa acidovorans]OZC23643.1 transcription-repair-coupling factor [Sporomusa acidovorans DSM 3132]SDE23755.1 transcription-repair coupling factor (superfamily II helicase) [Sporomusa acidovorans]